MRATRARGRYPGQSRRDITREVVPMRFTILRSMEKPARSWRRTAGFPSRTESAMVACLPRTASTRASRSLVPTPLPRISGTGCDRKLRDVVGPDLRFRDGCPGGARRRRTSKAYTTTTAALHDAGIASVASTGSAPETRITTARPTKHGVSRTCRAAAMETYGEGRLAFSSERRRERPPEPPVGEVRNRCQWRARQDSNLRPTAPEAVALSS